MKRLFLLFVAAACVCMMTWAAPTVSITGKKATITSTAAHEFDNWLIANPTALDGVEEVEFTSGSVMAAGDINELGKHGLDNLKKVTASGVKFTTTGGTTSITLTQIEELVMDDISIGNNQPIEIKGCTNLKTLSMKNADLSTGGRPSAMIIVKDNPALTSINMSGSKVNTSQDNNTAIQITGNDALKTINMAGTSVTPWYDHNKPNAHIVDLSDNKSLVGATLPTGITTDNVTGSEQLSWIGGLEEVITYPGGVATTTRTLKLDVTEGGQLAELMAMMGDSDTEIDKLVVTGGPLNADDLACLNATTVDLSGATVSASLSNVGGSVENLMLPNGYSTSDLSAISSENAPNLKVAGSFTAKDSETLPYVTPSSNEVTEKTFSTTELALYSFEKNNVPAFSSAFNLTNANIDKLSMAGQYGNQDLAKVTKQDWGGENVERIFNSSNLHYFDFTGATFDELTVTANGEEVTTNSMYYLKNYNVFTCKLPTGNTDVPPGVFFTNNGGWSSPLVEIDIPNTYTKIGYQSFYKTLIKELTLPSSMQSVGAEAFYGCPLLENVEMQPLSGSCTFGDKAFASCNSLKHVSLSEGVDGISNQMFYACGQLESIRIPTTCKIIKSQSFELCFSLHNFVIPEGVELLEKSVFDNAGLTDVYVMATSYDKIPKIYDIGNTGDETGTFSKKNIEGNNTDPKGQHKSDIAAADDETVLSYYQEEFSDGALGLGGGNCMVQLHYPESMSWFYNNKDIPTLSYATWSSYIADDWRKDPIAFKMQNATDIFEGYALGSYEYSGDAGAWPKFGPSADGKYWPTQMDYAMRLASGYTPGDEPTREAWRQFPLQGFAKINDETFTKQYDDTWYTMCFPWDMDDNTLFSTFNQKCEITEFVGVEVFEDDDATTEDVVEYSMVFHFDHVAPTYYMDEEHHEYERVTDYTVNGQNPTRTVQISMSGATIDKKYYTYKSKEGSEYVYWPFNTDVNTLTDADKAMRNKYNSIKHLIVFAGRPYMIHPSIGAKTGQPKDCTVAGVKKVTLGTNDDGTEETWDTYADNMKVEQQATTNGSFQSPGTKPFINPVTKGGGSYFFIGNIGDGPKDMLDGREMAYFLGVKEGEVYPKYFRKTKGGEGKWSQYSAIIYPDDNALANIEGLEGMAVSSSSTGAKAFDVAFGEWEVVTPTAIEEIIADAEQSEQPVKQVHMNVVFNINGQVVRQGTSVEGLPKGLYIINGKKYMVK